MKISINTEEKHRLSVLSYLEQKNHKVIDVGGAIYSWAWKYTNAILDFNNPQCTIIPTNNPYTKYNIEFFRGDITTNEGWDQIFKYVEDNGKFDFSICRHTIEDLPNPDLVCKNLQQISKEGFIAVPSKESELRKYYHNSLPNIRGMGHHRWIFISYKGNIYGLPKMHWIESFSDKDLYNVNTALGASGALGNYPKQELAFTWKDNFEIIYAHPFSYHDLPEEYIEKYPDICDVYRKHEEPWDVWKYLLNNSD